MASGTTNQLVIKYKESRPVRTAQAVQVDKVVASGGRVSFSHTLSDNKAVYRLPREMSLAEAQHLADQIAADPQVLYAHPDKRVYPAFVPNDPDYLAQWNLYEGEDGHIDLTGNFIQTFGINAQEAWDITRGSSDVVVAVLDSGMLLHSDINAARVLPGYDFVRNQSSFLYDAENDNLPGRDADPSDPGTAVAADECGVGEPSETSSWHGLLVSSIIMAEPDNSNFMSGIDHFARLLPMRVLGKCGGFNSDINEAMRWAVGLHIPGISDNPHPAQVINLSFSGSGTCSRGEQEAINAAVQKGAVVVVAAGNGSGNANDTSPANCDNVISVAASRRDGGRTTYTNTGFVIDLSAPGGDGAGNLVALSNNGLDAPVQDSFASIRGTSFSTAQVSAVVSLLLAVNPDLTPAQIETVLVSTAREFPTTAPVVCDVGMQPPCTEAIANPCTENTCGAGVINVRAALELATDPDANIGGSFTPPTFNLGEGGGGCQIRQESRFDLLWMVFLGFVLLKFRRLSTSGFIV